MKTIALFILCLGLFGCAIAPTIEKQKLSPKQSGQRINILEPVAFAERPRVRLLPGVYVERYTTPAGRVFLSDGMLYEFTPSIGEKTRHVGGFIALDGKPGVGMLVMLAESGQVPAHFGIATAAITGSILPAVGDLVLHVEFNLSNMKANGW